MYAALAVLHDIVFGRQAVMHLSDAVMHLSKRLHGNILCPATVPGNTCPSSVFALLSAISIQTPQSLHVTHVVHHGSA